MFVTAILTLVGCKNLGLWLDKNVGNNDGKYDGPTITATKTLSDGSTVTVGIDAQGEVITDYALTNSVGQILQIVNNGELTFEHDGIVYEMDIIRGSE